MVISDFWGWVVLNGGWVNRQRLVPSPGVRSVRNHRRYFLQPNFSNYRIYNFNGSFGRVDPPSSRFFTMYWISYDCFIAPTFIKFDEHILRQPIVCRLDFGKGGRFTGRVTAFCYFLGLGCTEELFLLSIYGPRINFSLGSLSFFF